MNYLIKNGEIVSGSSVQKADILVEGEKIVRIGKNLEKNGAEIIDASGRLVFPGFIDGHTHFDLAVAGTVTADDFETGTRAAILGGTTFIIDFASQDKGGHSLMEGLKNWHDKADGRCSCDYSFHMSIVEWNAEVEKEIPLMIREGITSFKTYMTYPAMMVNDCDMYKILKCLREYGCFSGVHCENAGVIDALVEEAKAEGRTGPENHPLVRPDYLEAEAVHRLLTIAGAAQAPAMIVHLTCQKSLEEVRKARSRGQMVYAETCPQYLLLDDSVYRKPDFAGAVYVCAPPIRKKEDQAALFDALAAGEIQTIATDHCSFTLKQKAMGREDFTKIPGGVPGVQTRAELIYSTGVREGRLTLPDMCRLLSENAAKLYGVYPQKGTIQEGSDADLVIFDPEKESIITSSALAHNTDNTPYEGMHLKGKVESVFLRGDPVVQDGELLQEKRGKYIHRGKNQLTV